MCRVGAIYEKSQSVSTIFATDGARSSFRFKSIEYKERPMSKLKQTVAALTATCALAAFSLPASAGHFGGGGFGGHMGGMGHFGGMGHMGHGGFGHGHFAGNFGHGGWNGGHGWHGGHGWRGRGFGYGFYPGF